MKPDNLIVYKSGNKKILLLLLKKITTLYHKPLNDHVCNVSC